MFSLRESMERHQLSHDGWKGVETVKFVSAGGDGQHGLLLACESGPARPSVAIWNFRERSRLKTISMGFGGRFFVLGDGFFCMQRRPASVSFYELSSPCSPEAGGSFSTSLSGSSSAESGGLFTKDKDRTPKLILPTSALREVVRSATGVDDDHAGATPRGGSSTVELIDMCVSVAGMQKAFAVTSTSVLLSFSRTGVVDCYSLVGSKKSTATCVSCVSGQWVAVSLEREGHFESKVKLFCQESLACEYVIGLRTHPGTSLAANLLMSLNTTTGQFVNGIGGGKASTPRGLAAGSGGGGGPLQSGTASFGSMGGKVAVRALLVVADQLLCLDAHGGMSKFPLQKVFDHQAQRDEGAADNKQPSSKGANSADGHVTPLCPPHHHALGLSQDGSVVGRQHGIYSVATHARINVDAGGPSGNNRESQSSLWAAPIVCFDAEDYANVAATADERGRIRLYAVEESVCLTGEVLQLAGGCSMLRIQVWEDATEDGVIMLFAVTTPTGVGVTGGGRGVGGAGAGGTSTPRGAADAGARICSWRISTDSGGPFSFVATRGIQLDMVGKISGLICLSPGTLWVTSDRILSVYSSPKGGGQRGAGGGRGNNVTSSRS